MPTLAASPQTPNPSEKLRDVPLGSDVAEAESAQCGHALKHKHTQLRDKRERWPARWQRETSGANDHTIRGSCRPIRHSPVRRPILDASPDLGRLWRTPQDCNRCFARPPMFKRRWRCRQWKSHEDQELLRKRASPPHVTHQDKIPGAMHCCLVVPHSL